MKQGKPRPCARCKGTGVEPSERERANIPKPPGGSSQSLLLPKTCKQCHGRKMVLR